jgi:hypothetical protein
MSLFSHHFQIDLAIECEFVERHPPNLLMYDKAVVLSTLQRTLK